MAAVLLHLSFKISNSWRGQTVPEKEEESRSSSRRKPISQYAEYTRPAATRPRRERDLNKSPRARTRISRSH